MWTHLDKFTKSTDEKMSKADEQLDLEFIAGERYSEIKDLEKENKKLKTQYRIYRHNP